MANKILVANLKCNYEITLMNQLVEYLDCTNSSKELIICPSNIYIPYFINKNYSVGMQDISFFEQGAYTGEVAASQASSLGVNYVIIGHYERRKYFKENSEIINQKIKNALLSNIKVILCIKDIEDLKSCLNGITDTDNIIVAYEPIESIGTKILPNIENIEKMVDLIKELIYNQNGKNIKVIYGGSIDDNNILPLSKLNNLDGYLIGTSALDSKKFLKIKEVIDNQ